MLRRLSLVVPMVLALGLPAAANASSRDRDHDHMPDRWERAHHLNTHRNDARRDADRDGLKNLAEFRDHTDPRDADTDNDGVKDAQDVVGSVKDFTNGDLTIVAPDGRELTAKVDATTEVECEAPKTAPTDPGTTVTDPGTTVAPATVRSEGADDNESGDDHGGQVATQPAPANPATTVPGSTSGHDDGDDDHGDDEGDDDHESGDDHASCDPATVLVPGAKVSEAELKLTSAGAVWHSLKIVA